MSGDMRGIMDRVKLGAGMANEQGALELDPEASPELAKEALQVIAKHIKPGEWAKAIENNPRLAGVLRLKSNQ